MLRTALKPRWIAALILALVVASVFVLLSQWQFSRSSEETGAPQSVDTETVVNLLDVADPGVELRTDQTDRRVQFTGQYLPGSRVYVTDRLDGDDSGYWVVDALTVDGAPRVDGVGGAEPTVMAVARGWVEQPADATPAPTGEVTVTGRLLPTEAPIAGQTEADDEFTSLSVAQLINRWDRPSWAGFVSADAETVPGAASAPGAAGPVEVGARAEDSTMRPIDTQAQPEATQVNWLNIFYAIEWFVFAGFALFLWWRLVADDYRRQQEDDEWDEDEYWDEEALDDAYDEGDHNDYDEHNGNDDDPHVTDGAPPNGEIREVHQ